MPEDQGDAHIRIWKEDNFREIIGSKKMSAFETEISVTTDCYKSLFAALKYCVIVVVKWRSFSFVSVNSDPCDPGLSLSPGRSVMAEPDYLEDCDELIKPKKLINPVKNSRNHQDLHRELLMNQKRSGGRKTFFFTHLSRLSGFLSYLFSDKQRREIIIILIIIIIIIIVIQ